MGSTSAYDRELQTCGEDPGFISLEAYNHYPKMGTGRTSHPSVGLMGAESDEKSSKEHELGDDRDGFLQKILSIAPEKN